MLRRALYQATASAALQHAGSDRLRQRKVAIANGAGPAQRRKAGDQEGSIRPALGLQVVRHLREQDRQAGEGRAQQVRGPSPGPGPLEAASSLTAVRQATEQRPGLIQVAGLNRLASEVRVVTTVGATRLCGRVLTSTMCRDTRALLRYSRCRHPIPPPSPLAAQTSTPGLIIVVAFGDLLPLGCPAHAQRRCDFVHVGPRQAAGPSRL